ncbi:pyridoxal phosphate-dependent decarboxylase family protein [Sungkyunkwania multivorans]|uniref:Pyridoxal phosphate-dependent decarboxylase family protein n=1 Tax=Sungkyunkwania multivorans TaxID=1173618 RepID=A0ABW3CW46_9FLAO
MTHTLAEAYNADRFRNEGHQLIDILSDYLEGATTGNHQKVIDYQSPEDELAFWNDFLHKKTASSDLFSEVLKRITQTHHPKCIGHQVSPTVPISALATLQSALLNNGMAVYEMGMAPTAMERIVIETINKAIGFDDSSGGFLTSGGTLGNLTALLCARNVMSKNDSWNEGLQEKLAIMVSEEAHYCVTRAVKIMGLGEDGIVKVPVDEKFVMDTAQLQKCYDAALKKGYKVIAVVGSAPSTSTGMYDNLSDIASFCKQHQLWFHVDAAHGGAAIFSAKYRSLLKGIKYADSVVIDGHKMMATSSITTALLFKENKNSYKTFTQKAQYLWGREEEDWYNMARRTFECTKSMMSLRFYAIINAYGTDFFSDYVNTLYDSAKRFAKMIEEQQDFELLLTPDSNIVCFRYTNTDMEERNAFNKKLREHLLYDGAYYIVETTINEQHYLRVTVMNPFTQRPHFQQLLDKIIDIANQIKSTDEIIQGHISK